MKQEVKRFEAWNKSGRFIEEEINKFIETHNNCKVISITTGIAVDETSTDEVVYVVFEYEV